MQTFVRVVRDIALLAARIVAGLTLVAHGWHRWQVSGLEAQVTILADAGLPAAQGLVVTTIAFELIGGVFGICVWMIVTASLVIYVIQTPRKSAPTERK